MRAFGYRAHQRLIESGLAMIHMPFAQSIALFQIQRTQNFPGNNIFADPWRIVFEDRDNALAEFVTLAKSQPGKLNYGSSGASTQAHLLIEMWSERAGIKMQHIPYKGGAPAALAVATNEVQFVMLSPLGVWNFVEAGKVRPLASGGLKRDATLPNLPTASESGFPGFEAVQWLGLLATRGTPKEIIAKINREVNRALQDPGLIAKLAAQGTTAAGSTPDEFKTLIANEIRNWKETAAKAGIKTGQ